MNIVGDEDKIVNTEAAIDSSDLEPAVLKAIEEFSPSADPLDSSSFNAVNFINELFPTEQSLANIDETIRNFRLKIKKLDEEIRSTIRNQSSVSVDGNKMLKEAEKSVALLFSQMNEIKLRVDKSERMVEEITSDIKQLDSAKKNLSNSITTLNQLEMLMEDVERLDSTITERDYAAATDLIQRLTHVVEHFIPYMEVEEIKKQIERIDGLKKKLMSIVKTEFEEIFSSVKIIKNVFIAADLCKLISVLDEDLKNELIAWFVTTQLKEYTSLFQEGQEAAWVDKIDRRYTWFKKVLIDLDEIYGKILPLSWNVPKRLAIEFMNVTRAELAKIMQTRRSEIDIKLLKFAIERTTAFESLVQKRFHLDEDVDAGSSTAENPPSCTYSISKCFEDHCDIYLEYIEKSLNELIDKFAEDIQLNGFPECNWEDGSNVLPSSADLFVFYKNCLLQLSKLSTGMPLVSLTRLFSKYLGEYANRVLSHFLPKLSINQGVNLTMYGIQNFQNILKEGEVNKLSDEELSHICCILCTAEYCIETVIQLEEKLKEKIDDDLAEQINFNADSSTYQSLISTCVQTLVQDLSNRCDQCLNTMTKLSWQSYDCVGDQSSYVNAIIGHLRKNVPFVRNNLASSRKYFTQFCLNFINTFIPKYTNCIFKCKPINTIGAEQLLLDTHSLKTELLDLPNIGSEVSRKAPITLTRIVTSGMAKAEMILKVVMSSHEPMQTFVENYIHLTAEHDIGTFQKILDMKGVKRNDMMQLVEIYKAAISKNKVEESSSSESLQSTRIKRLESLIKKTF